MEKKLIPGPEQREGAWYKRLTQGAPLAVLLAAGLFIAYEALPVLKLIAVAMLIALVLRTVVQGLEKLGAGPWLSAIVLIVGVVAFGAFVWIVLVPRLVQEVLMLIAQAPGYIDSLTNLARTVSFVPDPSELEDRLQSFLSQLVNSLPFLITSIATVSAEAVAVLFLSLYMSINPTPLISGALRLVPGDKREETKRFLQTLRVRLRGWIVGTALVALFIGTGGGLGLWILGVPLPLTFGVIAGLLSIIPYVGSTVGALLPALIALTISPAKALLVVVLFIILNQLEGHILQPLIMGRQVRLQPTTVIISFLILGTLLGFVGVLLAVPTAVFFATLLDELSPRETEEKPKPSDSNTTV